MAGGRKEGRRREARINHQPGKGVADKHDPDIDIHISSLNAE